MAEPALTQAWMYFTLLDARGWIYVGTDAGVAVFDRRAWRRFSQPDGLIWNDTDQNGGFIDTWRPGRLRNALSCRSSACADTALYSAK
jgi:hypothetical protein